MGRELRIVPKNWKHPRKKDRYHEPLFDSINFKKKLADWNEGNKQWKKGFREDFTRPGEWIPRTGDELTYSYSDWAGGKPNAKDYMPLWDIEERTHIQLYESTSEGTPITPIFRVNQLDELCEYAAKRCYTFADGRASKSQWKSMLKGDLRDLIEKYPHLITKPKTKNAKNKNTKDKSPAKGQKRKGKPNKADRKVSKA